MDSSYAILIVDDSSTLRNLIRKSLESAGYNNIIEAINGKAALNVLSQNKIDLIISDLIMPELNGLELLRALIDKPDYQSIPFIVLTSETSNETFKEVMKTGATDFIKKPFTSEDLINKIKSIIAWS